jgi:hypothetical protein
MFGELAREEIAAVDEGLATFGLEDRRQGMTGHRVLGD